MNRKIPVPILFNPYKHHFTFLVQQIPVWQNKEWESIQKDLQKIGKNLIDFYIGKLSVEQICRECVELIEKLKIRDKEDFSNWLAPDEYRKIELSDKSLWVIKESTNSKRYIHIHPAKKSPFTIRVKASTLKTALALSINSIPMQTLVNKNLDQVNDIRKRFLQLSPVKNLHKEKGILPLWNTFIKNYPSDVFP